ncbi:MAG: tetratricopeptide repeat protein [Planctomycetes bacterium]|nr:tetratricopeptide repeat protein [Planctomycetota bacterium]
MLSLVASLACFADELVLKNGIRVQGEITAADFEKVTIVTAAGKPMAYKRDEIKTITRSEPESFAKAQSLLANGDYDGAIGLYEQAAKGTQNAWHVENARARLIECYCASGQWDKAAQTYLALAKASPSSLFLTYVPVPKNSGQVKTEALGSLDKAAEGLMGLPAAAARAVKCAGFIVADKPADARRELDALAAIKDPRAAKLSTACQAHLLVSQKQHDKALELLRGPVANNDGSESPWLAFWQGSCYLAKSDHARAALAFLRAPVLDPQFSLIAGDCLFMAGQCFDKLGQKDKALAAYREVVEKYPVSRFWSEAKQSTGPSQSKMKGN